MKGYARMFLVALVLVSCLWAEVMPPTLPDARAMIERLRKETAEEEKLWAEEKSREVEAGDRRQKRYDSFVEERQKLRSTLVNLDRSIAEKMDSLEQADRMVGENERRLEGYSTAILQKAGKLGTTLNASIPYAAAARSSSLKLLISDLRKNRISPEEALSRLAGLYMNEHRLAGSAEVYSGDMMRSSRKLSVKFVRLGKQVLAYVSEDGASMGIMDGTDSSGNWTWQHEDSMDSETRRALRRAIGTAEGRELPGFTDIPMRRKGWQLEEVSP